MFKQAYVPRPSCGLLGLPLYWSHTITDKDDESHHLGRNRDSDEDAIRVANEDARRVTETATTEV